MAVKGMNNIAVNVSSEKLKVLQFSLQNKDDDLSELTTEFVESLYKKRVPKVMQEYIESEEVKT